MAKVIPAVSGIESALSILADGGLVAVPTETVYGLAADACNEEAVRSIYAAKGRPSFNPLIAHVSGLPMAQEIGSFDDIAMKLARAFWPGALTLVVPLQQNKKIAPSVTAGLGTIALRHPKGIMAELAGRLGNPIAAPSANSSGKLTPTRAEHVQMDIGDRIDLILDDGPCPVGLESTIVKVVNGVPVLLREGGIPAEDIEALLGADVQRSSNTREIEAPGQLLAHYAPEAMLRLNATDFTKDEAVLAFGKQTTVLPKLSRNLSEQGSLSEAASNLFSMLKELDLEGATRIAVQPIPTHGLGAAINDRLKRAAHRE